jgi:hypothetical protein
MIRSYQLPNNKLTDFTVKSWREFSVQKAREYADMWDRLLESKYLRAHAVV